jgi:hypothetical protein
LPFQSSTGSHGFGVGYQPSKTDLSSDSGSVPGAGGTLTSSAAFLSADCGGLGEDDKLLMVGRTGSTSSLSAAGGDGATIGGGGVVQVPTLNHYIDKKYILFTIRLKQLQYLSHRIRISELLGLSV